MSIIYCEKHDRKWDSDFKSSCPVCDADEWPECAACNGYGYIRHEISGFSEETCQYCNGKGFQINDT